MWMLGKNGDFFVSGYVLLMKRAGRRDASATVGAVRESIARQE